MIKLGDSLIELKSRTKWKLKAKKSKRIKLIRIGKLKEKVDRVIQDWHRANSPEQKCEMCPKQYHELHHFIWKSQSNYLRNDPMNWIRVCRGCHYKFHGANDPMYPIILSRQRGPEWVAYIESHRRLLKSDNRIELNKLLEKYKV